MTETCASRREEESDRPAHRWWVGRIPYFMTVGVICTVGYFGLYLLLREPLGAQWSNLVSLVLSTLAVTAGNRRFTFHVHSKRTIVPHQVLGLLVLVFATVLTSGSLLALEAVDPEASRWTEVVVLAVANGIGGCVRFAAYAWAMRERSDD